MLEDKDERSLEQKAKKRKWKLKSHVNIVESVSKGMEINTANGQKRAYKKQKSNMSSPLSSKLANSCRDIDKHESADDKSRKSKKRRKRKRHRDNVQVDEGSQLERRTKYLLVRMKLEQNLIDAYSGEGWKGQSREKIKPDKELQRAKNQILKCKLGIREAIRKLDLLSSEGCMEKSVIAQDGTVHHEHIICAKCKLQDAFPDNDIILCDGTCNCAYHQKCLDPPLLTENIPPGDQGWYCKFCVSRMKIIETTNAHLGTHFCADTHWQDIFREEATLPDGEVALDEQEWPSDDSEDDDYDPDKIDNSENLTRVGPESDDSDEVSSSTSLWSLEDEVLSEPETLLASRSKDKLNSYIDTNNIGIDTGDTADCEILSGPRQRRAVDYRKLYDEMFGKEAPVAEQNSEDEDWGPAKRKRKQKESDAASTLMTLSFDSTPNKKHVNTCNSDEGQEIHASAKRQNFRIPHDAVEKLRLAFAENELPSRATREKISKELGIDYEKINKWFKNARYMALKARKAEKGNEIQSVNPKLNEPDSKIEQQKTADQMASEDLSSALIIDLTKHSVKDCGRKKSHSHDSSPKKKLPKRTLLSSSKEAVEEIDDDTSLKLFKDFANKKKKSSTQKAGRVERQEPEEAELERLFKIKDRVEKLQNVLHRYQKQKSGKTKVLGMDDCNSVIYVPVAELVEKQ